MVSFDFQKDQKTEAEALSAHEIKHDKIVKLSFFLFSNWSSKYQYFSSLLPSYF